MICLNWFVVSGDSWESFIRASGIARNTVEEIIGKVSYIVDSPYIYWGSLLQSLNDEERLKTLEENIGNKNLSRILLGHFKNNFSSEALAKREEERKMVEQQEKKRKEEEGKKRKEEERKKKEEENRINFSKCEFDF